MKNHKRFHLTYLNFSQVLDAWSGQKLPDIINLQQKGKGISIAFQLETPGKQV